MDSQKIKERIAHDVFYLTEQGYNVLGVFLQGSQNYKLDYESSDIDTKAIVIPSFEDFVLNRQPVSTTIVLPSNEHIDVKDIRLMMQCFKKQNINFLEILFTKYYYIMSQYQSIWQPMFDNAEKIAHYNNYAAVNCIAGMVFEKHKALCHPYPSIKDKVEKYGYDNKQLHHILRCHEFLCRWIDGISYSDCLIPTNPQHLVEIKSKYIYNVNEAKKIADAYKESTQEVLDKYRETHEVVIDKEAEALMNKVLTEVLKQSFLEEMG